MLPELRDEIRLLRAMLAEGSVALRLNSAVPGTVLPPHLLGLPLIVLQVGINDAEEARSLEEDAFRVTLGFFLPSQGSGGIRRTLVRCVVPWEAVLSLCGWHGGGRLWPERVPEGVSLESLVPRNAPRPSHGLGAVGNPTSAGPPSPARNALERGSPVACWTTQTLPRAPAPGRREGDKEAQRPRLRLIKGEQEEGKRGR